MVGPDYLTPLSDLHWGPVAGTRRPMLNEYIRVALGASARVDYPLLQFTILSYVFKNVSHCGLARCIHVNGIVNVNSMSQPSMGP